MIMPVNPIANDVTIPPTPEKFQEILNTAADDKAREEVMQAAGLQKIDAGIRGVEVYAPQGMGDDLAEVIENLVNQHTYTGHIRSGKLIPLVDLGEPEQLEGGMMRSQRIGEKAVLQMAAELGFQTGICLTVEAFDLAVRVSPAAAAMGCDYRGRVWDLLYMLSRAAQDHLDESEFQFQMIAVTPDHIPEKDGCGREITLKSCCGVTERGPFVTVMLPHQEIGQLLQS